ncbi:Peptidoglycan-associated lipoprotein [Candidatus Providencia siddallii]|uniref:Peptidoglycan-associated lipoprotein n=1 Tax=Candidatus Providencia siddallii TaxID=1715285 RepID=A0A0M6W7Z2_9GAMM|nr:Peptidoglycan-associated lipoprotein [Candidatus Providencia siddallii]
MQFNKILKLLIIALPIMVATACNSNKNNSQDNSTSSDTSNDQVESGMSTEELMNQQMEQLQQNNIIYFDFDKYNISSEHIDILDSYVSFLRSNPSIHVIVEGHADERGTPEYNIALGERRANAVKMYLQSKGVSGEQISIVSYGEEKPSKIGHSEIDYAKNRRAVIAS